MKSVVPNYYKNFQCIADKCRHSCCIGWEIDIDEDSLDYYQSLDGKFGTYLMQNIIIDEETAHFQLKGKEERCPFLKENGLCEMILTLGEESLCSICHEHPRFYHMFSDREETGLGLCCEEAARLILSQEDDTVLEIIADDGEAEEPTAWEQTLLSLRQTLFNLLQKREKTLHERANDILSASGTVFPQKSNLEWYDIFCSLEQLDPSWQKTLEALRDFHGTPQIEWEKPFEKLLLYFLYRHTAEAEDTEDFSARVAFAYLGYTVISLLCAAKQKQDGICTFYDLTEYARRYSSEIEYSEENTETLLDILRTYQTKKEDPSERIPKI